MASEWICRGSLASLLTLLGATSVAATLGFVIKGTAPDIAHRLAPWDGRITAEMAWKRVAEHPSPQPDAKIDLIARQAVLQDPTAVIAIATLGIQRQLAGEQASARRLFAYSQRLSRRNLQTQLWAIEDAVARNDIDEALRHYDIALRTSPKGVDLLFPILVSAIGDGPIRSALARTLVQRPPWGGLFVEYASANGPDPRAAALLFSDLNRMGYPVTELARELLVDRLASQGLYEDAWRYYASFRPNVRADRSRDADFSANLTQPNIFDWRSVATDGLTASIEPGLVDIAAPSTTGGTLLRQVQMLPPGDYGLSGHSVGIDQPDESLPYWTLTCRDGRELGQVPVSNSAGAGRNFAGHFNVPAGCTVQTLALVARPSYRVGGMTGRISHVQLKPTEQ